MTTPLERYAEAKRDDWAMLLIRCGDFYELFHDDARIAAKVLRLSITTMTGRNETVPMAGFPYHFLDKHVKKLRNAGIPVSI